jgi:hypothetical protein
MFKTLNLKSQYPWQELNLAMPSPLEGQGAPNSSWKQLNLVMERLHNSKSLRFRVLPQVHHQMPQINNAMDCDTNNETWCTSNGGSFEFF